MTRGAAFAEAPLVVNGWSIYAHPVFFDQLEGLIEEVEVRKVRDSKNWYKKNCTKRLAAIFKLANWAIPAEPSAPAFRHGDTRGDYRKHWFRAKFFQQCRLFYRINSDAKVLVLAW
ncbi:Toxin YhaV [Jannaschia donghaensis]|uniref:Toxin YhaV n=1 Tax=Jannaschia donghaensis TaxID=420998 RepID=A0A0M6YNS4_9RHOB|nr:Toxin YhaV [Jannaschia donghaensis]